MKKDPTWQDLVKEETENRPIYEKYEFVPMCCGTPLVDDKCRICGSRYDEGWIKIKKEK